MFLRVLPKELIIGAFRKHSIEVELDNTVKI
jgi:hypothetical protein